MQAVVKDYVELSFDQLPSIMEFLRGLITQEGPVIVYTHCEGGRRGRRGGEVGWGERGVWWYIQIVRWVGRGRGEEGRGRGERGGKGGEER